MKFITVYNWWKDVDFFTFILFAIQLRTNMYGCKYVLNIELCSFEVEIGWGDVF